MKLLVLGTVRPDEHTHGMGICLGNTLRALRVDPEVQVTCGLLLHEDAAAGFDAEAAGVSFVVRREGRSGSDVFLRGLVMSAPTKGERAFLELVQERSRNFDRVIWFASAWDPVSLALPARSTAPVMFHINDSISLFQSLRGVGALRRLKRRVAEWQERRVLHAGYRPVLYVSRRDASHVLDRGLAPRDGRVAAMAIGVDVDRFQPPAVPLDPGGPMTIVLSGVMNFLPNVRAARILVERVLPLVRGDVRIRLVGKTPAPEVLALSGVDDRVEVTGAVADMTHEYQRAHLLVAPIDLATGSKCKVLEALACGLPVVTTPAVLDTFGVTPGTLAADSAAEFASAIDRLADDVAYRESLGRAGREHVVSHYSWRSRTARLLCLLRGLPTDDALEASD